MRCVSYRSLGVWIGLLVMASAPVASQADKPGDVGELTRQLHVLLARIDANLVADSEADARAYLDARVAARVGPVLPDIERFTRKLPDGGMQVSQYWGRAPMQAYLYFDAYDVLGDPNYLRVALDLADYYLRIQEPEGFWHFAHLVSSSGQAKRLDHKDAPGKAVCRIQDAHQSGCFYLMLHAWRVTGERKYYDSARRCADYLRSIENANGSWPDYWIPGTALEGRTGYAPGKAGVLIGCSYNDHATNDPLQMMIVMYHLTKDANYVARVPRIGQWIFDTQLGQGKVRGWCQQYGLDNKPLAGRNFEGAVIELRTFSRFIVPLCTWFYVISGQERYLTLMQETADWVKSVEKPGPDGGWAYQYLCDGTPVFTVGYQTYRLDQPTTWPSSFPAKYGGIQKYSRDSGGTGGAEQIVARFRKLGLEAARASFTGPVSLTQEEYLRERLSAAKWATDSKHLQEVRNRPLRALKPQWEFDREDNAGRKGEVQWEYMMKVAIARGRFTPEQLAPGAPPHFAGQRLHSYKVPNWLDIPWSRK